MDINDITKRVSLFLWRKFFIICYPSLRSLRNCLLDVASLNEPLITPCPRSRNARRRSAESRLLLEYCLDRRPRQDQDREDPERRSEWEERATERRHDDAECMSLARRERPPRYEDERRKGPPGQNERAPDQRKHQPEQLRRERLASLRYWRFDQEYQPDREVNERKASEQRRDCGAEVMPDGELPKVLDVFVHKNTVSWISLERQT